MKSQPLPQPLQTPEIPVTADSSWFCNLQNHEESALKG